MPGLSSAAVSGLVGGITNDDPFGQPAQLAHLAAGSIELAAKIFAAILSDVAAGKPAQQMAASIQAVLGTASSSKRAGGATARSSIRSHRLVPA